MENRAFKIAGIRNLLKRNYKLPLDCLNLEDMIDDSLGMAENWHNGIKEAALSLIPYEQKVIYDLYARYR